MILFHKMAYISGVSFLLLHLSFRFLGDFEIEIDVHVQLVA